MVVLSGVQDRLAPLQAWLFPQRVYLELQDTAITAMALHGRQLVWLERVPLPAGTCVAGHPMAPDALGDLLGDWLLERGFGGARVRAVLPSQATAVRLLQGEGAQNTISRKHAQLRVEGNGAVKLEDLVCIYVCALLTYRSIDWETDEWNPSPCLSLTHTRLTIRQPNAQGALNGLFVNRIKVLTATLQHNDLVQFGGAAGLKAGDTLAAPPPSTADAGNAIVYRFVVRPKEQQPQGQGQGAAAGKRPAAVNGHAPAIAAVEAAATADDDAAASSDAKRRRVVQEEGAQGEGNGNGAAAASSS